MMLVTQTAGKEAAGSIDDTDSGLMRRPNPHRAEVGSVPPLEDHRWPFVFSPGLAVCGNPRNAAVLPEVGCLHPLRLRYVEYTTPS